MRILLHGAINGTNFGDCLFAGMFYERLIQTFGYESVFFYDIRPFGIGNHLKEVIHYDKRMKLSDYKKIDALVYISGGYFGDSSKSLKGSIIRYLRYLIVGLYAIKHDIRVYVIGLEVGPIHYKFVKRGIKKILENAKLVIVRNEDSLKYVLGLDVQGAICTADSALSISSGDYMGKESSSTIQLLKQVNKKIVFLHMLPYDTNDDRLINKIVNPVIKFIESHKDYCIIYGTDGGKMVNNLDFLDKLCEERNILIYRHQYTNWYDMCYFLSKVDIIVTRKLHVGILGSKFHKSIISTPMHLYKTMRFYKQIGEEDRCIEYDKLTNESIYDLLLKYAEKKVSVPDAIVELSNKNIDLLVEDLKGKNN